jgi:uncharacterized protein DUF2852
MGPFVAWLEEVPRPVWIGLAILGFIMWGPLGLAIVAILGCLIWSANMGCCGFGTGPWSMPWQSHSPAQPWGRADVAPPSGNQAFEAYRAETLRRLEEDHRAFQDFLVRLRAAKDKAEFDQFMAERRGSATAASAG